MQAVSSPLRSADKSMSHSFEVISHALAFPEQCMSHSSFLVVSLMSQLPRLHEGHWGMIRQASHSSQLRGDESDSNPLRF